VHAQLSSSSDLIPIHVSENCNEEGLLKLTDGFGYEVPLRYLQSEFLKLFFMVRSS
jgi:hypothetical protein